MNGLHASDILIFIGFLIQIFSVFRLGYFAIMRKDVIVSTRIIDRIMTGVIFVLIIFFAVFYYIVFFMHLDSLSVSLLLFFGSIFVAFMIHWLINITLSMKKRCIQITGNLVGIMENLDPRLDGHSVHLAMLMDVFYEYLPIRYKNEINPENLKYAALFHDIGKLGVPTEVLTKPGKLTSEEWELVKKHPELSVEILEPMKSFDPILGWIRYHHERMDGKGYYGLSGSDIPVASRMMAIADTYSAVTMNKSYKPSRTYEDGIMVVRLAAGSQFDPELVDVFCNIPKHRIEACGDYAFRELDRVLKKI